MEELLAHPQFHAYSLEDVERVVVTNDKQRFKLRPSPGDGRLQIKASQGHSIKVNGEGKQQMALKSLCMYACLYVLITST